MADELVWDLAISEANLGAAPTTTADANVYDARTKVDLGLSAQIADGVDPTLTIDIYFWDALAAAFYPSGDQFVMNPASDNLALVNPNGLILGFVATPGGTTPPTSYNLNIGSR